MTRLFAAEQDKTLISMGSIDAFLGGFGKFGKLGMQAEAVEC